MLLSIFHESVVLVVQAVPTKKSESSSEVDPGTTLAQVGCSHLATQRKGLVTSQAIYVISFVSLCVIAVCKTSSHTFVHE